MASPFIYLPYIMIFTLGCYLIILFLWLVHRRNQILLLNESERARHLNHRFRVYTKFDDVISSSLGSGFKIFLTVTRLASLAVILTIGSIINGINHEGYTFYTYSSWNSNLVSLYFLLSFFSSCVGIYTSRTRSRLDRELGVQADWSHSVELLGIWTHLLFEIMGSSTMLAIIIDEFYDKRTTSSYIGSLNIITFVIIIAELGLSNLDVRLDQYPATFAWSIIYLLFVWPSVFQAVIPFWPYNYLRTDEIDCFGRYLSLFLINFATYIIWFILYKTKEVFRRGRLYSYIVQNQINENVEQMSSRFNSKSKDAHMSKKGTGKRLPQEKKDNKDDHFDGINPHFSHENGSSRHQSPSTSSNKEERVDISEQDDLGDLAMESFEQDELDDRISNYDEDEVDDLPQPVPRLLHSMSEERYFKSTLTPSTDPEDRVPNFYGDQTTPEVLTNIRREAYQRAESSNTNFSDGIMESSEHGPLGIASIHDRGVDRNYSRPNQNNSHPNHSQINNIRNRHHL